MVDIVTRQSQLTQLTHSRVDQNFINLAEAIDANTEAITECPTNDSLAAPSGASLIGNTPSGGVSATTVQGAINELDAEKVSKAELAAGTGSSLTGFTQSGVGTVQRTVQAKLRETISVKDFGATGDGAVDDTLAFNAACDNEASQIDIPSGTYKVNVCNLKPNGVYRGIGNPIVAFSYTPGGATAWLGFKSGGRYEGITFQSNEPDLEWQRGAIEDVSNVTLRDCALKGFRHASALPNAWGLHIARSSNILIDNCEFADNSQSDIAITDTVRDLTIIGAKNTTNNGVLLNIEPNSTDGVVGMNVIGGHFREIQLNENNYTAYASRSIVASGARVDKITYDGSGVTFTNCEIGAITNFPDGNGDTYAGALMIDNASLGKNLITDERFMDVGASDTNSYWAVFASGSTPWTKAFKDADGRYVRTNPDKTAQQVALVTRNAIPVVPGEVLILFSRARVDNSSISGKSSRNVTTTWLDAGNNVVKTNGVISVRGPVGTFIQWCDDVAILVVPANATQLKLSFGAFVNSVSTDQSAAGLFRFRLNSGVGNMRAVIAALACPSNVNTFYRASAPSGSMGYAGYFVGDRVINSTPAVGQPKSWLNTVAGTGGAAGTFTSEGNL